MRTHPSTWLALVLALGCSTGCDGEKKSSDDDSSDKSASDDDDGAKKKRKKKKKKKGSSGSFRKGEEIAVQLKVSAADADDLACATVEGDTLRCAFSAPDVPANLSDTSAKTNHAVLQPFSTIDGQRLLIAGVWTQPQIQALIGETKDRFLASCTLKLDGATKKASIRTFPSAPWSDAEGWWRAQAVTCSVAESDKPKPSPKPLPPLASTRIYVPAQSYSPRIGPEHAKVTIMVWTDVQ